MARQPGAWRQHTGNRTWRMRGSSVLVLLGAGRSLKLMCCHGVPGSKAPLLLL